MSLAGVIRLVEYQDWVGHLSEEDGRFISNELSGKLSIRRELDGPQYVINPNQFVGVLTLPSGRNLESRSKVPVSNLFYMLATVLDFPSPFKEDVAEFDRLEQILEFVAAHFANLVEARIDQGLYRSYSETEANLSVVRGRISFREDLRINHVLRHRTFCRYSEFTWDTPENQIIRQVVYLLSGWNFGRTLRLRLTRLEAILSEITMADFKGHEVDQFHYHRMNDDYRPIHALCRLFLESSSLSEHGGAFEFRAFLLDMNALFERFVSRMLEVHAPYGVEVKLQEPMYLAKGANVRMRPDIAVRSEGKVALVADCKYKHLKANEFKNEDVYQLLAYCTASGARQGLLVYPLHEADASRRVVIRNTGINIRITTVDLGKKGVAFAEECGALAKRIYDYTHDQVRMHVTALDSG